MRKTQDKTRSANLRQGLSFVEFVGCLAALGGGVVLGTMYLGVDLKTVTLDAVERSELIDLSQFGLNSQSADAEAQEADESLDENPPTTTNSPGEAKNQLSADESARPATVKVESSIDEVQLTEEERATRAYWNALTTAMREEAAGRETAVRAIQDWQLFDYLSHRRKGHQKAAETLERLRADGVDEIVTSHAKQVYAWHLAGAKLFERAVELLTDGPNADFSGPFAQSWQSGSTQHRMEETLILDKHLGVVSYLDHTYKSLAPFKPVEKP